GGGPRFGIRDSGFGIRDSGFGAWGSGLGAWGAQRVCRRQAVAFTSAAQFAARVRMAQGEIKGEVPAEGWHRRTFVPVPSASASRHRTGSAFPFTRERNLEKGGWG